MRDASALIWQAIVFLVIALSYTLISQDLALFPHVGAATVAALLLACLALLAARQRRVLAAAGTSVLGGAAALLGATAVFYDLVFVVSPARTGMLGLVLAYLVGSLLGYAAHAGLAAGRILWRLRAINPYFPQVGVAPPPSAAQRRSRVTPEAFDGALSRRCQVVDAPEALGSAVDASTSPEPDATGDQERRYVAVGE